MKCVLIEIYQSKFYVSQENDQNFCVITIWERLNISHLCKMKIIHQSVLLKTILNHNILVKLTVRAVKQKKKLVIDLTL